MAADGGRGRNAMILYIVRHAIAEQRDADRWPDDHARPLSERGVKRFHPVAHALARLVPELDLLLSSRAIRAWSTAEMLTRIAGWPEPSPCRELEGAESEAVCTAIRRHAGRERIAVVGHEPSLSRLVGYLLSGREDEVYLDFKKGAVVAVAFEGGVRNGMGVMQWMLTPKMARLAGPSSSST